MIMIDALINNLYAQRTQNGGDYNHVSVQSQWVDCRIKACLFGNETEFHLTGKKRDVFTFFSLRLNGSWELKFDPFYTTLLLNL